MNERRKCPQETDYCPHADSAADRAVSKVFSMLGVDVNKPESVEEFRMDIRFGSKVRKTADRMWMAVWAMAAAGIIYALWDGIKVKVGQ